MTRNRNGRGFALAWTAVLLIVLIGIVGLSIDWGKVVWNAHQLQNAADAAALAGAQIVKTQSVEAVRERTRAFGFTNTAEGLGVTLRKTAQPDPFGTTSDKNYDIIIGRWLSARRQFFPTLDTPDAVRVIARRANGFAGAPRLAMLFGPIFGVPDVNATREAVGWCYNISGAGLIVLDTDPNDGKEPNPSPIPGLSIGGGGDTGGIRVVGGTIHVNAVGVGTNTEAAVYVNSTAATVDCGRMTVSGKTDPLAADPRWDTLWTIPFSIEEGAPYLPDPLRGVVPEPIPTDADGNYIVMSDQKITDGALTPGYYPYGIEVKTGKTVTLDPGVYWIGGGTNPLNQVADGLVAFGGKFFANNVRIYLTKNYVSKDATGQPIGRWARLDVTANAQQVEITPRGDYVTPRQVNGLPGVSLWQDRQNYSQASVGGGGAIMISGTLYFPHNHVILSGNPGKAGNQIICGSLELHGKAEVLVNYDGRNNIDNGSSVLAQ